MPINEFMMRLGVAILAGLIIGIEREIANKSAGLRTNTVVAVGAAIYVLLSVEMTQGGEGDVTRIIGQVVTGVGFLGGGVILHRGINVHGLTTAATIWCSSAVGCMAAAGFLIESLLSTAAVILINVGLRPLDMFFERRKNNKSSSQ
jgi:putative Mg2+ transporter-C (MgtC) family protein